MESGNIVMWLLESDRGATLSANWKVIGLPLIRNMVDLS